MAGATAPRMLGMHADRVPGPRASTGNVVAANGWSEPVRAECEPFTSPPSSDELAQRAAVADFSAQHVDSSPFPSATSAVHGLQAPSCASCRENLAVRGNVDTPMARVPSGVEGFHVMGLGNPGSWSPITPDHTDLLEWDAVREWSAAARASAYRLTPLNVVPQPLLEGLHFPRMNQNVEMHITSQYRAGACMRYPWSSATRQLHAIEALSAATHPLLQPQATANGYPEVLNVPGQLQLTPSLPLVVWSEEKKHLAYEQTVAAVHTPESILTVPGVPDDVQDIFLSLCKNVLGDPQAAREADRKPFYELGWRRNLRDNGSHTIDFEGSYSLAATSSEGLGVGHVQPAAQRDERYMRVRQRQLLFDVGRLAPIALQASLSRLEFDLLRFRGLHFNIIGLGHEDNLYVTSLQINVSFLRKGDKAGQSLVESLGRHQGCNHVDPHDCICGYTVFVLICSAPAGTDVGPFCFPESGAFAHSASKLEGFVSQYGDVYVAVLVFKGRSLHGGLAPRAFWNMAHSTDASDIVGVRVGLVAYPNGPTANRTGTLAPGPPNGFSSSMNLGQRRQQQRSVLQAGLTLFGTRQNLVNWVAREYAYAVHNDFAIADAIIPWFCGLPFTIRETLERVSFVDEEGVLRKASTTGFLDPVEDHDAFIRRARLFEHLRACATYFNLGISKPNVKSARREAEGHKKKGATRIPPFHIHTHNVSPARVALRIAASRATSKGVAFAIEFEDKPGELLWVENANWPDCASKTSCMQEYVAILWEESSLHGADAVTVPEIRLVDEDPVCLPVQEHPERGHDGGATEISGGGETNNAELDAHVLRHRGGLSVVFHAGQDVAGGTVRTEKEDGEEAMERNADDPPDEDYLDELHIDEELADGNEQRRLELPAIAVLDEGAEQGNHGPGEEDELDMDTGFEEMSMNGLLALVSDDTAGGGTRATSANEHSAAPAPGDSQPHRGTLGRLAKTTAAHAYKEADIRSANKSHGKRKSAAEKKAAQPQENAEPHVCTGSGSERKGLPETEQTTDAPTDSDGTGTTASAATQVEQLAGSKRPREGADLRVSSSEPGKDVIILESEHPPLKRKRVGAPPAPLPPPEHILAAINWEEELEALVKGRDALLSVAKARDNINQMFARMQAIDEPGCSAIATAVPSSGARALMSLHLAIDSAKEHVDVLAKIHLGQMLSASGTISACAAHVHMKTWLLEDGPALAHAVFKPILQGVHQPVKLGVTWLDDLVAELYRAVITDYGGRARLPRQKGTVRQSGPLPKSDRIKRKIQLPPETPVDALLWPSLRRTSRVVAKPPIRDVGEDRHDEGSESSLTDLSDQEGELDEDEESGDCGDRDDDSDFVPGRLGRRHGVVAKDEASVPDVIAEGAGETRNRVELFVPKLKTDGRPSASAGLAKKKHTIKTGQFWLEFEAFESGPLKHYNALVVAFVETLFELLMAPGLRRANLHDGLAFDTEKSTKRNGTATQRLIALVVGRGWMLETFRAAAGTDLVWMSASLAKLWRRPHHNFPKWKENVWRMVQPLRMSYRRALQQGSDVSLPQDLARFQADVRGWFEGNAESITKLHELARHFHYHVDELRTGSLERASAEQPHWFQRRDGDLANRKAIGTGARGTTSSRTSRGKLRIGAVPSDLTGLPSREAMLMPALMLSLAFEREERERATVVPVTAAAADATSVSVIAPPLRQEDQEAELLFTGLDPTNLAASNRYTRDMVNPVRAFWDVYKILNEYIPADRIREPKYLKNLVMAIATGQSVLTRDFLVAWMQTMPETTTGMRELYDEQKHVNVIAMRDVRPADGSTATISWQASHSNFVPMEDMRVYGTTCNEFSFHEGEAIAPIFGDTITRWLSGFLERNPRPHEQVSWEEMGKEITTWGIKPFVGDGLAKLHLCHHLADRGLCIPATVVEVGRWISNNRGLGAFKALDELGFQPLESENDVVHAFQMKHDHLDTSLTEEQKTLSKFDSAMVENYLCKIHRMGSEMARLGIPQNKWAVEYFSIPRAVDVRAWDGEALRSMCKVYGGS